MPQTKPSAPRGVVFGASSQIGRFVVAQLVDAGWLVLALSRSVAQTPLRHGVIWQQARLPDAVPSLAPAEAIFSLGPLDLFARWLHEQPLAGRPAIVAISSMSVVSKAHARLPAERALAARLHDAEQHLLERCATLGLACTLLRPTLIYGAGMDHSLTPWARAALRWRLMPVPRASGLRQPLHAEDLAHAVVAASRLAQPRAQCFEIGGGERLTVSTMFARVRASLPRRSMPLVVPHWCLQLVGQCAPWSSAAAKIARFDEDLIADNAPLERCLGVRPRGFAPTAASWQPPGPAGSA